ncbi:MAG: type II toxin-antitoxin system TacA family antitoxin [Gammaproteobacteria bacterium]
MRRAAKRKEHPLSMRLPDADIAIIDRAAGMRGRSRTDFVREAAVRAAEDVLMEATLVRMSPTGFNAFMKALAAPAAAVPAMVELLRRPAPWETSGSRK